MDIESIKNKLIEFLPDAVITDGKQYPEIIVPADKLRDLAKKLKEDKDTYLDFLFCQTGMDWKDSLGVIYHLASSKHNNCIVLKTKTTDLNNPSLPTVSDIWRTAEYHEREIYDLLGIKFKNHPDMRRFFLDENWVGHPLRKDYTDEENIISR